MKRFLECLVPNTSCNMKCEYCYVIQQQRAKTRTKLKYKPQYIAKALSQKRLGGVSYISITAEGETLMLKEVIEIAHELLKEGHYVNLTTNGTLTKRFDELVSIESSYLKHLNISFSMHYDELTRLNKLSSFFENIKKARKAGCSFVLQINLCDNYAKNWDKIKSLAMQHVGALPQVALTRKESPSGYSIFTNEFTDKEYYDKGSEMKSPLFDFTFNNFNKKQKGFCYAGAWSAKLNLFTGEMSSCYGFGVKQNIYKDITKDIVFKPIGYCPHRYCVNSSHFLSLGVKPQDTTPSYGALRNRKDVHWYSAEMEEFLNQKLSDMNEQYSKRNQSIIYSKSFFSCNMSKVTGKIKSAIKNIISSK